MKGIPNDNVRSLTVLIPKLSSLISIPMSGDFGEGTARLEDIRMAITLVKRRKYLFAVSEHGYSCSVNNFCAGCGN